MSNRHVARLGIATVAFFLIVVAGSVGVGSLCFPAYSHGQVRLECDIALFSPAIAAVVCGFFVGWRSPISVVLCAAAVPTIGLGIALLTGHLQYWYGQDVAQALKLAALFCVAPALVASAIAASISLL